MVSCTKSSETEDESSAISLLQFYKFWKTINKKSEYNLLLLEVIVLKGRYFTTLINQVYASFFCAAFLKTDSKSLNQLRLAS